MNNDKNLSEVSSSLDGSSKSGPMNRTFDGEDLLRMASSWLLT
jgi:hypothetical protein